MDKQRLIDLTNVVYKLTLLFPKKEPLRYKTREVADDILATFINGTRKDPVPSLEVLDGFFEVAKGQNWVKPEQLLEIQREYANLKRGIERGGGENPSSKVDKQGIEQRIIAPRAMPERQDRILAFLREQGRAQVWQVKNILPEVTKRTLRRDFEALLKQGLIERIGERNNTFYQIRTA
mgnify:CR=1 FL=1